MTAPSSTPRGERPGTPGVTWETELVLGSEEYVPDGAEPPRANRAARRAAKRAARRNRNRRATNHPCQPCHEETF
ncbi:hypothetical protein D7231_31980 [Streptomyces klenkii]|uniref:Uncharacterized protein n=1 Tax=Streptomyces klenkii TaxID=1420899 RepID=A0A3B0AMN6_9ACTN|nr:hypothetical protein [Streptomyces klenkii]RKN61892.1 hypothetical protein D7231_31980 [Streptomyces klenkii]